MRDHERQPAEIERDVERARAQVSATIDAIQSKLTPGQMMDQAVSYLRTSLPAEFGHNLADAVRTHPVPVALVGVGLAWLAIGGRNGAGSSVRSDRYRDDLGQQREFAEGRRSFDDDSDAEGRSITKRAGDAAERAGEKIGEMKRDVRYTARRARSSAADFIEEQPLVFGALGVALGAALGASLPRTETEDEVLGATRDDLMQTAADKTRAYANRAADTAKQAIHEAG